MRRSEEERSPVSVLLSVALGALLGTAVCILLLLGASALISAGIIDEGEMYRLCILACFLGALAGGLTAARRVKRRLLPVGLAVGGALFLVLLLAGVLTFTGVSPIGRGLGLLLGALAGGMSAGLFGARPKRRRRR